MGQPDLAEAINAVFRERDEHGRPRWRPEDIQAVRNFLLLDLARRGEAMNLNDANKLELAQLLDVIGFDEHTPPDQVDARVRRHFEAHPIPPAMAERLQRLFSERAQERSTLDVKQSFERWTGSRSQIQKDPRDTGDGQNAQQFSMLRGLNIKI
jgi:hypothetical protein